MLHTGVYTNRYRAFLARMKNSFHKKFQNKRSPELAQILSSRKHHLEAKEAALKILNDRNETSLIESSKIDFKDFDINDLLNHLRSYDFDFQISNDQLKISRNEYRRLRGCILIAIGLVCLFYVFLNWFLGITSWELRYPLTLALVLPVLGWIDLRNPKYLITKIHSKGIDLKKADSDKRTNNHFPKSDRPRFILKNHQKWTSILVKSTADKPVLIAKLNTKPFESTQDFGKNLVNGLNDYLKTLFNNT